ncbi:MAG: protein kinase [Thermoanaerobaculia bacterium]
MTLPAGHRVGSYEIVAPLGAGGMGEVYRARDMRLGRDVALKFLPPDMAAEGERLARFDREARLLASLSHPNIGVIHGLEESDGAPCLVLELIPGETLAERIAAGPLPLDEAVGVCRQIARAVEAAHQNGVLHRDLKPANIKITPDGTVKVLDFGLAKAFSAEGSWGVSHSPTITTGGTRDGVLLGTAAYMSPEQARGKPLDARSDVWSFGCVLYEALTGERAFPGDTVPDILAAVIHREPDWARLPAGTSLGVRRLLERCLRKDRDRRLHAIADARLELEEPWPDHEPTREEAARRPSGWRVALPWVLAGLFALTALAALWIRNRDRAAAEDRRSYRLQVALPPGEKLAVDFRPSLAISPDGSLLAYAAERGGVSRLSVRPLEEKEAALLPGTEGASEPFFSPDGKWIGFFAAGKLRKVPSGGGTPVTICEAVSGRGAAWLADDSIVFTPNTRAGLWRVPAAGGTPQELTKPVVVSFDHRWAEPLRGGSVLFTAWSWKAAYEERVLMYELGTGRTTEFKNATSGRFVSPGDLVYMKGGALFASAFDLENRKVTGPQRPLAETVFTTSNTGAAHFAFSRNGTLAYVPGGLPTERTLVWRDHRGVETRLPAPPRAYMGIRLSPDGSRVAVAIEGPTTDVWVHHVGQGTLTRLTFDGDNAHPIWRPDGKRLAYTSRRSGGVSNLFWVPADGSGPPERLTESDKPQVPTGFSPDGRFLVFQRDGGGLPFRCLAVASDGRPQDRPSHPHAVRRPLGAFLSGWKVDRLGLRRDGSGPGVRPTIPRAGREVAGLDRARPRPDVGAGRA